MRAASASSAAGGARHAIRSTAASPASEPALDPRLVGGGERLVLARPDPTLELPLLGASFLKPRVELGERLAMLLRGGRGGVGERLLLGLEVAQTGEERRAHLLGDPLLGAEPGGEQDEGEEGQEAGEDRHVGFRCGSSVHRGGPVPAGQARPGSRKPVRNRVRPQGARSGQACLG
ncbi:MAG: hypothetical protein R3F20_17495 [Planctomycetota bacterium]